MVRNKRAHLISVLLLGLTLAVGFMFGVAWNERRSVGAIAGEDTAEVLAEQATDEESDEAEGGRNRGSVILEVGLEPDQRAAVEEIISHFRSSMRALNEGAREDYNRKQTTLLMATRDSIRAILNPDQIAQYDSLLAVRYPPDRGDRGDTRRERRRDDRPESGGGGRR